jgi:hypothetical protein
MQNHAHAPYKATAAVICHHSDKQVTMDGPKENLLIKELPKPLSPTLKKLHKQPPNAAHATLDLTNLHHLLKKLDIGISWVTSQLVKWSPMENLETHLLNPLVQLRDNPLKKFPMSTTTKHNKQVVNVLQYAQHRPDPWSDEHSLSERLNTLQRA